MVVQDRRFIMPRVRDGRHGPGFRRGLHPVPQRRDLMQHRGTEDILWDGLSVGATRPAVIKGLNVPFWFVLPISDIPLVITYLSANPFLLLLIGGLTLLGALAGRPRSQPPPRDVPGADLGHAVRRPAPLGRGQRGPAGGTCIMATDRHAKRFLPQVGHWASNIAINQDGSLLTMFHLSGLAAKLSGARAIVGAAVGDNQLDRNITDPRIKVWDHGVRQDGQRMSDLPTIPNWFAARFDDTYAYLARLPHSDVAQQLFARVVIHKL